MATLGKISAITLPDGNNYDIRAGAIPYGEVDSTSTATAYTATVPGISELTDGTTVLLRNGVVTSASGFTININGLGAKPSYSNMATGNPVTPTNPTRDTTIFNINYTMLFTYSSTIVEGGGWICYRGYDANTNTIGYQLRTNSQSLPMKSVTYRYRLLFTSADGKHYVPANNSTSTNATSSRTVCQDKIDPFGPIYYYGTTASVVAGSRPSATYLWNQYTLSLGYSFNRTGSALTLTSWRPVYVKCAPQTDGSAIIDSTTPYVQELPSTDDGKIYIFLGVAYSATSIELLIQHPVYYFKDGQIRLYTNQVASGSSVSPYTSNPEMDGTASAGSSNDYARGDHVHPSDTSRVPTSRKVNGKALSSDITLSASDVNALPSSTSIPTKVSDLTNDSGYITGIDSSDVTTALGYTPYNQTNPDGYISNETDPTVPSWAKAPSKPSYSASEISFQWDDWRQYGSGVNECMNILADEKQDVLVSGTNIKTINNTSLLGSGNITIPTEYPADEIPYDGSIYTGYITENATEVEGAIATLDLAVQGKQNTLVSGTSIKTINNESLLGSGNITISGGGADNLYPVNVTLTSDTSGTSDKSVTEIGAAINAGKFVYVKTEFSGATMTASLAWCNASLDTAVFVYEDQSNPSSMYYCTMRIVGTSVTLSWKGQYLTGITSSDVTSALGYIPYNSSNPDGYISTETDPTVPSWAKESTKPSYTASEVGALATTGGQITGNLTLYASSGNSPAIIFQRGTLGDNYNDWKIYDRGGYLYFAQRGSTGSDFADMGYIDTSGVLRSFTIPWASVSGKPTIPTDANDLYAQLQTTSGQWSNVQDALDGLERDKQDLLTAGTGINISSRTIKVDYEDLDDVDLDTLQGSYVAYAKGNCTNMPTTYGGMVISRAENYGAQLFITYSSTDRGVYYRRKTNGTWSSWLRLNDAYVAGDSFSVSSQTCIGHITNSSKTLEFSVQLPRQINASTVTVNNLTMRVRASSGGYILQDVDVVGQSGYTISASANGVRTLYISIVKSSAFTVGGNNVTNNTPVAVELRSGTQFTLS